MKIIRSAPELERFVAGLESRPDRPSIGFVPTMGALHAGHASLIRRAHRENDCVIVSIFVNPLQFGPKEDFSKYPRTETADLGICRRAGASAVFIPALRTFLEDRRLKKVYLPKLAAPLCGRFRPGHFQGVVDIVAFFFGLVRADRAYFGLKDYQQYRVIEAMGARVFGPLPRIVPCPTVREKDGLAMSSRNRYLKPAERRQARAIIRTLRRGRGLIRAGKSPAEAKRAMRAALAKAGIRRIDYLEIVDPFKLRNVVQSAGYSNLLIVAAVRINNTRLIDNLPVITR